MIYSKFNLYIKNKFFPEEKKGNAVLFSIDEDTIQEFLLQENMEYENFRRSLSYHLKDWSAKIKNENYFGICAIQVFIVSQMQEDEDFSSKQYNPRLAEFIGINIPTLQKLYTESQDNLWKNLELYSRNNHFQIHMPTPTVGKGCYIQYPLSQALLTKEDLKRVPVLFEKVGIKKAEYLSFEDFTQLIEKADKGGYMHNRYYKIKNRLINDFQDTFQLNQQLYNYFNESWDGSYPPEKEKGNPIQKQGKQKNNFHLFLSENMEYVFILNDEYDVIDKIYLSGDTLFSRINKYQKTYHPDLLLFKKEKISEEAEYVRNFEFYNQYIIICKKFTPVSKAIYWLDKVTQKENLFYDIYLTGKLNKKAPHLFWEQFFSKFSRKYKIEGGVKLGYKCWMHGCGPVITFQEPPNAWLNGKRIETTEINATCFPPGIYKLVTDSSVEKFEIKVPQNINSKKDCYGWVINKQEKFWLPNTNNPNIVGYLYKFSENEEEEKIEGTRTWIDHLIQKKKPASTNSQVLQAIKRANYGI